MKRAKDTPVASSGGRGDEDRKLLARRQSLKEIGKFAVYTAPAMLVLLSGNEAEARRPGHPNCNNPGHHGGFGRGRGNRHSPC